ncbi:MAG: YcnI family protein, partial [Gammaproteobacteria bacterium]|nr:YcnI family protein [Gammaproteobacteria bacterium]
IKPRVNGDWGAIRTIPGNVPTFYSHGEKSGDVRAIQWLDGFVPDSMYENLELKASLPKLEGCVGKLRVYTPVVQFCDSGLMNAWIKEPTNQFSADVISAGYAPYFDVVRNNTKNPLPESCGGVAETVEVYPSAEDIDSYLPVANPVANKASAERNDSQDNASLASVGWFSVLAAALLMLMRTRRRLG